MNSAKNGLTVVGELPEEVTDGPGCLTVKTRGRLVQEQEESRASGKLNANCESLALLDIQTYRLLATWTRI
jgi:hypothetical protein